MGILSRFAVVLGLVALAAACDATPSGETSCIDGIDNDMNGQTDCADTSCAGNPACSPSDAGSGDGGGPGCDPSSCPGCCDGDRCQSGESLAACGTGGVACEACALGATCEPTGCEGGPVACGPANCDGCCVGDTCAPGDSSAACGTGGAACAACEGFEMCMADGCGVDPGGEWQIEILDAVVPPTKFDGSDWDGIGAGECDPFVEIRVGSAGATPIVTPTMDGTLTPDWTGTLTMRVTAGEILAFLRFDMVDEDLASDDTIGMCRIDDPGAAFDGEIQTLVCPPDAISEHAGFTLRWRLVPG